MVQMLGCVLLDAQKYHKDVKYCSLRKLMNNEVYDIMGYEGSYTSRSADQLLCGMFW